MATNAARTSKPHTTIAAQSRHPHFAICICPLPPRKSLLARVRWKKNSLRVLRPPAGWEYLAAQAAVVEVTARIRMRFRPWMTAQDRVIHNGTTYGIESLVGRALRPPQAGVQGSGFLGGRQMLPR
ncbi:MAG: phage head closure protein [Acidovorax sp.]|uniref:phage head closure protein n=1 Tax=Acidovorax sp. TaxID=1872122 RepID=UPI003918850B